MTMKKFIIWLVALCAMASLAGCGGSSGDLKGFLSKAAGDWYIYGNSADEMLRVSEDGIWEIYAAKNGADIGEMEASGNITYNSDYKNYDFNSGNKSYSCDGINDGILTLSGDRFFPAEESRDLGERFDGEWYLDGDSEQDHYTFAAGQWQYWRGYGSSESGYLEYRGGDKKTLTAYDPSADDPFAEFNIVGDDEIKTKDGQTFIRMENGSGGDNHYEGDTVVTTENYYYHNGDADADYLYFYDDLTVEYIDIGESGSETITGFWFVSSGKVLITWDDSGEEIELTYENGGDMLVDAQGEVFILIE